MNEGKVTFIWHLDRSFKWLPEDENRIINDKTDETPSNNVRIDCNVTCEVSVWKVPELLFNYNFDA